MIQDEVPANYGETLVFGTTTGNVFVSENGGDDWDLLTHTLPMVYRFVFVNNRNDGRPGRREKIIIPKIWWP
jgi:hypothetical protein